MKVLGVMIDSNLNFSNHVSTIVQFYCQQLLLLSSCVTFFCGKINNVKIEKIQELSLIIFYKDYESTYDQHVSDAI